MYPARTISIKDNLTYQVTYREKIIHPFDNGEKVTDINRLMLQVTLLNECAGISGELYTSFHNPQNTILDNVDGKKILRSINCQQLGHFPKSTSKCDACNRVSGLPRSN